jgi:5-methylcytosine-specific restriction protein A
MSRARLKVCSVPGCPAMQAATLCPAHARERERVQRHTTPTKATRTWTERTRRAQTVAAHRDRHGNWCPGYGVPAHAASDLTADHLIPIAHGGAPDGPLGVLCRACNSRKAARDTDPEGRSRRESTY